MDGLCITNLLTGAAVRTVIANVQNSIIFDLDNLDRARLHAIGIFPTFFPIDLVHIASLPTVT